MAKSVRVAPALEILNAPESPWVKSEEQRAMMTLANHDGDGIPRIAGAGGTKQTDGKTVQLMHNGLKVLQGGYQGEWQIKVIKGLKGIHEPQEEKAFYEVIKRVRKDATMLELGSWWSYYSMWFISEVKGARAFCCEPDPENLELGIANATLNDFKIGSQINFRQYAAGSADGKKIDFPTVSGKDVRVPIRSIDSIVDEEGIDKLDILHMDIQGIELDALQGALKTIKEGKLRFLFVSTHHYSISGDPIMHQKCIDFITQNGGSIVAKHSVLESCSGDGLIVASFDAADKDFKVAITLQPTDDSLFRTAEADLGVLWAEHDKLYEYTAKLEQTHAQLQSEHQAASEKNALQAAELEELRGTLQQVIPLRRHIKTTARRRASKIIGKQK